MPMPNTACPRDGCFISVPFATFATVRAIHEIKTRASARTQRVVTTCTYPLAMARIAARPLSCLDVLRSSELFAATDVLICARRALRAEREIVSAELHRVIGQCANPAQRGKLVRARRSLYNGRSLSAQERDVIRANGTVALERALEALERAATAEATHAASCRTLYTRRCEREAAALREIVRDETLLRGVALSSQSLFERIKEWSSGAEGQNGARYSQVERGVLRYLTRMVMKATPFSTFCRVAAAEWRDSSSDGAPMVEGQLDRTNTCVRLNKALYGTIWVTLRARDPVRNRLRLRVAPALRRIGDVYELLSTERRREVFRRVPATPIVDCILDIVRKDSGCTIARITDVLIRTTECNAARADLDAYVRKLVDAGLLQPCAVVDDQEPDWDVPLARFLGEIDDPTCVTVASSLGALREALSRYEHAASERRMELLTEMRRHVAVMLAVLELEDYSGATPIFEDVASTAALNLPGGPRVLALLRTVREFGELLTRLAPARVEQANMRHFLDAAYGVGRAVPLLEFYREYYRDGKKERVAHAQSDGTSRAHFDPFRLPIARALRQRVHELVALMTREWAKAPGAVELQLPLEEVRAILHRAPERPSAPRSVSCFLQVVPDGPETRVVLKRWAFGSGHGKYFSRFLPLLPERLESEVKARNERLAEYGYAEILGDASFNGNLHPPLLAAAIAYPTCDTQPPPRAIGADALDVVADADDENALLLIHRESGRRVIPVDVGFLVRESRAPFYQLLVQMGDDLDCMIEWPDELTLAEAASRSGDGAPQVETVTIAGAIASRISYRPRVLLGSGIVLARRRWRIPRASIPRRERGESGSDFFVRLSVWRVAEGLPDEGYVSIYEPPTVPTGARPLGKGGETTNAHSEAVEPASADSVQGQPSRATEARRISRDARKPQYVHFGSPALCRLFEHMGGSLEDCTFVLDERYPTDEHALASSGERFTYELLAQFDRAGADARQWRAPQHSFPGAT